MNEKQKFVHKKGFVSVMTLILMMMSLGVIMAMLYRSTQGLLIAGHLKQSNQAYQESDTSMELVLQNFRKIDDGAYSADGIGAANIPENIPAYAFCVLSNVKCYDIDNAEIDGATAVSETSGMLSNVVQIGTIGTSASTARSLMAPVPQRISIPDTDLTLTPTATGVDISWLPVITSETNPDADMIEIRRASLTSDAQKNETEQALLSDTTVEWTVIGDERSPLETGVVSDDTASAGNTYAYTFKVTSKNPITLDSFYFLPVKITK